MVINKYIKQKMMFRRTLPKVRTYLGSSQLRKLQTQSVANDYNDRLAQQIGRKFNQLDQSPAHLRNRGQYASMLPDYDVPVTAEVTTHLSEKAKSVQELQERHPFDASALESGARQEFCAELADNEVLLMNLPDNHAAFDSTASVIHFLKENVHSDLVVESANLVGRIDSEGLAFVKLTLASKRQANMVSTNLRQHWFGDKLLKVRTKADAKKEQFGNRTIIVRGLPSHLSQKDVIKMFSEEQYGAMVGVEMPTRSRDQVQETQTKQNQEDSAFKRAQSVVEGNLRVDQEYQEMLVSHLGKDDAVSVINGASEDQSMQSVLSTEKLNGLVRVVLRLQAEGSHVLNSKVSLMEINKEATTATESQANFQENLLAKKEQLKAIILYLQENPSTMQSANPLLQQQLSEQDSLSSLMNMAEGEITHALDEIIAILNQRESLIDSRLKEICKHFGDEERILIERKNFGQELEDVPAANAHHLNKMNAEDILSVNEQIHGVERVKTQSNYEKVILMLQKALNPFQKTNFNKAQMDMGGNQALEHLREFDIPDPRVQRSIGKIYGRGAPFLKKHQAGIDDMIEDLRQNSDQPFDELYHREKALIQNVINAEIALKKKIDNMTSPLPADYTLSQQNDGAYEKSKVQMRDRVLKQKMTEQAANSSYDFNLTASSGETGLLAMVENGSMSKKNYERALIMQRELNQENLGYAFVTFSHADEARSVLIDTKGSLTYADGARLEFDLIARLQHGDFDSAYYMNKAKNNAKLVDDIVEVRHARQELRDFEKDIDNQLPSRKKLKKIRDLAKEVIENNTAHSRDHASTSTRGARDEARLNDKMRDLQQKYPHVDFTQLFETDRAEDARKVLHKKAYASYKAFEFLKNGLKAKVSEQDPLKLSPAKQRLLDNDPYNFPELNEGLSQILSSETIQPRIRDGGDVIKTPGRRFTNYTEGEMIEAYFGRDYARRAPQFIDGDDGVFSTQKTFKELHPVSQFTKGHLLEMDKRKNEELGMGYDWQGAKGAAGIRHKNKEIDSIVSELMNDRLSQDNQGMKLDQYDTKPHPTDKNKGTYYEETQKALEKYFQKREEFGMEGTYDTRQVGAVKAKIRREYQIDQKKSRDWYDDLITGWRPPYNPKVKQNAPKKVVKATEDETVDAKFDSQFKESDYDKEISALREQYPGSSESKLEAMLDAQKYDEQRAGRQEIESHYEVKKDAWNYHEMRYPNMNQDELTHLWNEQVRVERDGRDQPASMNSSQQRINKEYAYNYRHNKDSVAPVSEKQLQMVKDINGFETDAEAVEHMSQQSKLVQSGQAYGGAWFRKFEEQKLSGNKVSAIDFEHKTNQKRLADFYNESDLSEREEQDIYEHYRNKQAADNSEIDADLRDFKNNLKADEFIPEMPRFQDYLDDQSQGVHPFDKITQNSVDLEEDHADQKMMDEELYRRELMGRLVSERLTPRQFEMISDVASPSGASKEILSRIKDVEHNNFMDRRELIRISQEKAESIRRRKVMDGEWAEGESHARLNDLLADRAAKQLSDVDRRNQMHDAVEYIQALKMTENPERLLEKEYYFDEGLGQSLQEHTAELKKNLPGMKVEVRRDRDGFAIVKSSFSPELKYPIDMTLDATKAEESQKKSVEVILQALMPGTGMEDCVSEESLERGIRMMTGQIAEGEEADKDAYDAMNYEMDTWTKLRIQELVNDRTYGRYKDDDSEFAKAFTNIAENCGYDYSKQVVDPTSDPLIGALLNKDDDAFTALFEDRDRLRHEINFQINRRARKHLVATERKESDFVQPRASEASVFGRQMKSNDRASEYLNNKLDNMQDESSSSEASQGEEAFDRAAYDTFKAELSQRKEAKERLLSQGIPEFKAYLRF